jgi:cellulose synthase/poly-beta-1,6-N-acetylglucosamine synthase-like glycosyltransferase
MTGTSQLTYWDALAPSLAVFLAAIAILPWLDRNSTAARTATIVVCLVLAWRYMFWRIFDTLPPVGLTADFALGVLFTSVEALAMFGSSISMFYLTRTRNRSGEADRNVAWLKSLRQQPLVDVLICTYNEEEAILERTIIGALGIDYSNYRLWICDDGHRPWLKKLCEYHGCGYITRKDNANAKAGNINNALQYLSTLPERPDFVAILDADFVPKSQFLTRTVALMREPDVGVVQTPQHFYNPDPIQRNLSLSRVWPDEQRYFFDIVMASKDAWGGAFCCGTSSLLRFAPLMQVKKFPTDSVTEDYLVTLRLAEVGYRTIYLNEPLSLGLAPEGLKEYISQRSRWALGFMQICRGPSGPFSRSSHAPFLSRLMLVETFLYWSATPAFRLLALLVPTSYLLLNIQAVYAFVPEGIYYLVPFLAVQLAVMSWLTQKRVLPIMVDLSQLLAANDLAKSVIVGLFKPQGHKFEVTAKGGDRTKRLTQWPMLRIFLIYLALSVAGIVWAFALDDSRPLAEASGIALVWTWYNIVLLVLACFVCIEAPQVRIGDRFHSDGHAALTVGDHQLHYRIIDVSVGGMRLAGIPPQGVGNKPIPLNFDGVDVEARIIRTYADGFGVQFVQSRDARARLIRLIYGGKYGGKTQEIKPGEVVSAMVNRVFR